MSDAQKTFLQNLSAGESGGDYGVKFGESPGHGSITDFSQFPQWAGVTLPDGSVTHGAGRYQFQPGTWAAAAAALGLHDFSPGSQDRAAWWLAAKTYREKTGRNLQADIQSGGHQAQIANALQSVWTSMQGGGASQAQTQGPVFPGNAAIDPSLMFGNQPTPHLITPDPEPTLNTPDGTPSGRAVLPHPGMRVYNIIPPKSPPIYAIPTGNVYDKPHGLQTASLVINGGITVNTAATDAHGIARSIKGKLSNVMVDQANRGLA
jgi:muramidase (phage lysozyme)